MTTLPRPLLGWPLLPVPDPAGRLDWPTLDDSVRELVRVVLSTRPGEQLMRPDFGAGVESLLFEPNTVGTRRRIRDLVAASIERWEERNDCAGDPSVEELGSGVSRIRPGDCRADVLLYDIQGVGHAFIFHECIGPAAGYCREYAELDQLDEALLFFEDHPLPE